jgi:YggT family protein
MNYALANAVDVFFTVLYIMLFVRIILSWFPMSRDNKFMELLFALTEPVLAPIRNLVNRSPLGGPGMVIDFSPLIAFILLRLLRNILVPIIYNF